VTLPAHDLSIPNTDLAIATTGYVKDVLVPALVNHSLRSYLYGRFLGERQGLVPDRDYDDELLFLGCVLHDTGLSRDGDGEQSFDLDGADLAAGFLTGQGVAADRVEVVWDAIALHLCRDVALRKRPEIALVAAGAGYDLGPDRRHPLPPGYADRVHTVLPRLHAGAVLHDAIVAQAVGRPSKAPPFTLPGELVRQHVGADSTPWTQLLDRAPSWGDYDGYRPG
jgi:hypothetical protein